jgi:hypothetical protein
LRWPLPPQPKVSTFTSFLFLANPLEPQGAAKGMEYFINSGLVEGNPAAVRQGWAAGKS